jgi:hypothetical protein
MSAKAKRISYNGDIYTEITKKIIKFDNKFWVKNCENIRLGNTILASKNLLSRYPLVDHLPVVEL